VPELGLEASAEARERQVMEVERLDDDRRSALELLGHAFDVRRAGEAGRPPRKRLRVGRDGDLLARLDDAEGRIAQAGRADEPLGLCERKQVVEAPGLVALDEQRPALPVVL
jgi:hypothetical protein